MVVKIRIFNKFFVHKYNLKLKKYYKIERNRTEIKMPDSGKEY